MPRDGEKRPKKKGSEASSKPGSERDAIRVSSTRGSEASRRTSGDKGHSSATPQSLDPYSLVEAVEIVKHCLDMEKEVTLSLPDNIWDEAINLEPVLAFVAEPSFVPPSSFSEAMDTCVACLLMAEDGKLLQPALMLSMLEESSTKRVIKYLQWLEPAMNKVAKSSGNAEWGSSKRQPVKVQVVKNALDQWPSECARLRDSAGALWEAMLTNGAETIQRLSEWQKCNQLRSVIQAQQEDECARIADEIEGTSTKVVADIRGEVDQEWPKIAKTTENALKTVQRISSGLLTNQQDKMVSCMTEYEELDRHQKNCKSAILEARRQVRRRQQALVHSEQRFTQLANQLVAWISWLAPKLLSLLENKQSLRILIDLHQQIPKLEQEQADVEDELDSVTVDLRRHRRQYGEDGKSRSLLNRGSSGSGGSGGSMSEKQLAAVTKQYEHRESTAKRRLSELSEELAQVSREHDKVAKALPFAVVPEEIIPVRQVAAKYSRTEGEEQLPPMPMKESSLDDLATLLTDVTTIHAAANCPIESTDRYAVLEKVDLRRRNAAKAMGVHAAFCCPLTMQPLKDPVIASDGHTYERKAMEAWLRVTSTSPLTGTLLQHRHLVENLNLRSVMEAEGLLAPVEKTTSRRTSSSKKKKKAPKVTNEEDAATLIQRKFRQSIVAKRQNSDKKEKKKIKRTSEGKRSSRSSRGSRRSNDEERKMAAAKEAAAVRIQAIMRGRQARSIVAVKKEEADKLRKARIEHEKKEAAEAARKAAADAAAEESESYYESSESEYETDSEDEPPKRK
mmetsp:Transcript_89799/g.187679  ORF Transcript_89799/g.187679 Transcript_89799/m.187679 type:complete len:791 (+) Transcript_89799:140-2512(+)|eukprot:CAMPEP_0206442564 /NCGR_PEP_ID=MMETSP0324_2-20121206/13891_1 /ASSEMBLY_ACC=CAM_ASM_000836 /TAXON_ID=2866 /ORGANISM="Crypthecodinium cohnii, Strain Seligo" /LENGTH=790 /DNA_ID=CAMNT_0053910419 /DNA_START=140 /DNA_END=2512 /DNA_ORIENTATION=-